MSSLAADQPAESDTATPRGPLAFQFLRLIRPVQWAKSGFCLIGPVFYLADHPDKPIASVLIPALIAAAVFALASSACYVMNDLVDAEQDRQHPRKRRRPIASGAVSPSAARVLAAALVVGAGALLLLLPSSVARWWVGSLVLLYILTTTAYSYGLKHIIIADVVCLSSGFVIRVVAGCTAIAIFPSTWLLNCTLFLAMFLAFGKRLGERRTLGDDAAKARVVQEKYTDEFLRMAVVVTGVATLFGYASYVQTREAKFSAAAQSLGLSDGGVNILWLTMLPATYALLRCIVQVERGRYDDPTELAVRDRPFQLACLTFAAITAIALWAIPAAKATVTPHAPAPSVTAR